MARRFSGNYKNPYLKDVEVSDDASYQLDVLLDEARTRRAGTMKAKRGAFELQRERLLSDRPEGMKPDSARFELDVEEDLNGGKLTPEELSGMSYSPSYRPKGRVGEQISDLTISRLRYSALAGRKARAPKDLSFLADPVARERFESEQDGEKKRDGKLRRSTVRNEVPVEQRRAQLIEMLPKEQQEKYEDIAREVNEHREKRDIAQGKIIETGEKKKRYDDEDYSMLAEAMQMDDPTEDFRRRELDERHREERIPEQYGLMDSERPMPQLYSETRHWSRIESENPTWSEIQQNTETTVIGAKRESAPSNPGRYVSDEEFDPNDRYRQRAGVEPRRMPKLESYDDMRAISINPYTSDCVLSPEQIEKIMGDDFRSPGQLSLPEDVRDPKLRGVWYSTYGARYRAEEEKAEREQLMAQEPQKRKRTPHPARRRAMQGGRVPISERASAYREPVAQGYAMGQAEAERLRREEEKRKKIIEENERRLAQEKKKRDMEEQRKAAAQNWMKEQEEYRRRMPGQAPSDMPPPNSPQPPAGAQSQYTKRWEMQQQAARAWQGQQAQYTQSRQGQNPPPAGAQPQYTKRWEMQQQAARAWQGQQAQYTQSRQGQNPPSAGAQPQYTKRWEMQQQAAKDWQNRQAQFAQRRQSPPSGQGNPPGGKR